MKAGVMEVEQATERDRVVGVELCPTCSQILREAIEHRRRGKIELCASCRGQIRAKFVNGRWTS